MPYRNRRAYRNRKRRSGMVMARRLPFSRVGRVLRFRYAKNNYKFTRFGVNATIDGGVAGAGTVALNTTASGWALGTPATDANGTYQFGGAMQFQLSQCLEYADFAQLFDKYKIKGCKVTIIPLGQPSTNAAPVNLANTSYPTIAIAVDNDDAALPGSWNSIAVKQDCKIKRLSKPVSVYIRSPKIASAIYDGATTAYSQRTGMIDMQYPDVPHYGLKFWIRECPLPQYPAAGNGANVMFRVVTKFYLQLKDPQ